MRATQLEAQAVCEAHGDQLCTSAQLSKGFCCNTGCWFNRNKVWSSTPCSSEQAAATRAAAVVSKPGQAFYVEGKVGVPIPEPPLVKEGGEEGEEGDYYGDGGEDQANKEASRPDPGAERLP